MPSVQISLHKGAHLVLSNPVCSGAKLMPVAATSLNADVGRRKEKGKENKIKKKKEGHFRQATVSPSNFKVN